MAEELKILIVSRTIKFFNSIKPLITRQVAGEAFFAASVTDAQRILMTQKISAIIINTPLSDSFGLEFAIKCATEKNYTVLILSSKEFIEQVSAKTRSTGILTLQKPLSPEVLSQSLTLLKSTMGKMEKLRSTDLNRSAAVTELKILNRAKLLLIEGFGMTEEQAHKYIEKRAMESRKTKLAIAESIIKSYGT